MVNVTCVLTTLQYSMVPISRILVKYMKDKIIELCASAAYVMGLSSMLLHTFNEDRLLLSTSYLILCEVLQLGNFKINFVNEKHSSKFYDNVA